MPKFTQSMFADTMRRRRPQAQMTGNRQQQRQPGQFQMLAASERRKRQARNRLAPIRRPTLLGLG